MSGRPAWASSHPSLPNQAHLYSLIIAVHPDSSPGWSSPHSPSDVVDRSLDWRLGEITVDWVDFTREKNPDHEAHQSAEREGMQSQAQARNGGGSGRKKPQPKIIPGSSASGSATSSHTPPKKKAQKAHSSSFLDSPDALSLQPLLAHFPGPNPLESSVASGVTQVGRGVVHLFRHAPPASLISSLDAHPVGESSSSGKHHGNGDGGEWTGERAEGEDGSLIAILAVPAWMRPADFLEFIGGWGTCLEGVRMIREATTPNRSIVLLKFRDPLQASDFLVIFTGRPFSTLDARETCHPIRIHHLVLHKVDQPSSPPRSSSPSSSIAVPAFPPSVYASRAAALPELLRGIPTGSRYELPSCPVCLERLDSTVTGLVTLPCAHTFDCDCLRKWGDSRCPVCRVSHLLLSSTAASSAGHIGTGGPGRDTGRDEIMRLTKCSMCDSTEKNWICVVCGVVGCGRYEPGKGHARRHWEESGHVLAMELETQRVWDYKGDNYVHRLIQTRNDGKLVELPSASSLVTPISRPLPFSSRPTPKTPPPLSQGHTPSGRVNLPARDHRTHTSSTSLSYSDGDQAGPSTDDIDKISTIEAITLEYSYLLSSQLEAMRQHYESQESSSLARLEDLESLEVRARAAEKAKEEAERAREKAERKAEKAIELTRALQANLSAEKAMAEGLTVRIGKLREELERKERERQEKEKEVNALEETVRDLMFSLEAGAMIKANGGVDAGEEGDLVVVPGKEKKKKGRR